MVFEPTFDEIGKRSAELATGGDPDANLPVTGQDLDAGDDEAADVAAAGVGAELADGTVEANDLPPSGNE